MFPKMLDGAEVLFYTYQGDFGALTYPDGSIADDYHYLAIFKYRNESKFYLFCCDKNYEVINDWLEDSAEICMEIAKSLYKENIDWHKATE